MNMSETILDSIILIVPAAIIIGIITTLVFLIIRRISNIDKILNEINNENHK